MKPLDPQAFYLAASQARFGVNRTAAIETLATEALRARSAEAAMAKWITEALMHLDGKLTDLLDLTTPNDLLDVYYGQTQTNPPGR